MFKKDFQTRILGQEHFIAGHLFGTKLARNQQENYPTFLMIFQFCPCKKKCLDIIMWTKLDKENTLKVNYRHIL